MFGDGARDCEQMLEHGALHDLESGTLSGSRAHSGRRGEGAGAEGDSRKQREEEQNEKKKNTPLRDAPK